MSDLLIKGDADEALLLLSNMQPDGPSCLVAPRLTPNNKSAAQLLPGYQHPPA